MTEHSRSLGIVVYPDGSQAEVWQLAYGMGVRFERLAKPRRLTLAPFYLLVAAALLLVGCVHLPIKGDKPICLIDYQSGIRHCDYDTWEACHADLRDKSMCYHR